MLKAIQNMPNGVIPLFFVQGFSTFSYAILYSSLALFLTQQLGMPNSFSNNVVSLFLAFNYVFQLAGGLIGGRFLSNRTLFYLTILIQTIGLVLLASCIPALIHLALSLFLVGCGLNTTCYNSMLTQRFTPNDDRRETAFFLSYGAMSFGFCAGYIASGFFDYSNQYQYLFYASMLTNGISLLLIRLFWANLIDKNTPLQHDKNQIRRFSIGIIFVLLLVPAMLLCFRSADFSNLLVILVSVLMFLIIMVLGIKQQNTQDKLKIQSYLILALSALVFWMIYFTGPVGVTLFIKNNVDKQVFGFELATQWIRNINPMVIIIGAPLLALGINALKTKGYSISVSSQFISAFLCLALSFFFLSTGIMFADSIGNTNVYWVIGYTIMQGLAELLIAPVGYAMIGQIAPPQLQGLFMGTWMLVTGAAASCSNYFSNAMVKTEATNPLITNADYLDVFQQLGIWALLGAVVLYLISGKIKAVIDEEASEYFTESMPLS